MELRSFRASARWRLDHYDAAGAAAVPSPDAHARRKTPTNPLRARARASLLEERNPRGIPEPCAVRPEHRRRRSRERNLFRQDRRAFERTGRGRVEFDSAKSHSPRADCRSGKRNDYRRLTTSILPRDVSSGSKAKDRVGGPAFRPERTRQQSRRAGNNHDARSFAPANVGTTRDRLHRAESSTRHRKRRGVADRLPEHGSARGCRLRQFLEQGDSGTGGRNATAALARFDFEAVCLRARTRSRTHSSAYPAEGRAAQLWRLQPGEF